MSTSTTSGTGSPSAKSADEQVFLQAVYKEYSDRFRQNETLRQQSTTLVFALSATFATVESALLAFAAKPFADYGLQWKATPLLLLLFVLMGSFIFALGLLGRHLAIEHSERAELHEKYSRAYRKELETMFDQEKHNTLRQKASDEHEKEWKYRKPEQDDKSYTYWVNINYFLITMGAFMVSIPLLLL